MKNLISIIIPLYNAELYIHDAVESVVNESRRHNIEIIIVEDGSNDSSLKEAQFLKYKYPDIVRLYSHPNNKNKGAGASRNLGISKAKGKYICFLDADDYWLPGRLDAGINILIRYEKIDGVYDTTILKYETVEERIKFRGAPNPLGIMEFIEPSDLFSRMTQGIFIWHTNCIFVRRKVFEKVGPFDEDLRLGQDKVMWFRMAAMLKLVPNPTFKPVAVVRRHGSNRWHTGKETSKELELLSLKMAEANLRWVENYNPPAHVRNYFLSLYIHKLGCLSMYKKAFNTIFKYKKPSLYFSLWKFGIPGPRAIKAFMDTIKE